MTDNMQEGSASPRGSEDEQTPSGTDHFMPTRSRYYRLCYGAGFYGPPTSAAEAYPKYILNEINNLTPLDRPAYMEHVVVATPQPTSSSSNSNAHRPVLRQSARLQSARSSAAPPQPAPFQPARRERARRRAHPYARPSHPPSRSPSSSPPGSSPGSPSGSPSGASSVPPSAPAPAPASSSTHPDPSHQIWGTQGIMHGLARLPNRSNPGGPPTLQLNPTYSAQRQSADVIKHNNIQIGRWFPNQRSAMYHGAHGESVGGIRRTAEDGVYSVIMTRSYMGFDEDQGDTIYYCPPGSDTNHDANQPRVTPRSEALDRSIVTGRPVRVLRSGNRSNGNASDVGLRYDGLYMV